MFSATTRLLSPSTSPVTLLEIRLVGAIGLEPTTPTMSRWCSNQLSYAPSSKPRMQAASRKWALYGAATPSQGSRLIPELENTFGSDRAYEPFVTQLGLRGVLPDGYPLTAEEGHEIQPALVHPDRRVGRLAARAQGLEADAATAGRSIYKEGDADRQNLRGVSSSVSPVRRRNEDHRLHHQRRGNPRDSRPSGRTDLAVVPPAGTRTAPVRDAGRGNAQDTLGKRH